MNQRSDPAPDHQDNIAWNLRLARAVENDRTWLEKQLAPTRQAVNDRRLVNGDAAEQHEDAALVE